MKHEDIRNKLVTQLEQCIINQYSQDLLDWLWNYIRTIERLLENGRPIYESSIGYRWQRLNDKRNSLYRKMYTLYIVTEHITNNS